ncbi:hypothetical protein [Massilia endophytica]|uniref:hypothetical protein n=1 Tax=Massilia endophytica TaxID=2899220 RepID=UPI001E3FC562|nr:hypothetical protein [Massilia endophytica]UGQ45097.1 hypothetical protein LSQ66_14990 [Massilia endophytica]
MAMLPTTKADRFKQTPAEIIAQLLAKAFCPGSGRMHRSDEYKAGVRAILLTHFVGKPLGCPYKIGTSGADAFFAGVDEGRTIWAEYQRVQERAA